MGVIGHATRPCKTCQRDGFVDPGEGRWTVPCPDCDGSGEIVCTPTEVSLVKTSETEKESEKK